MTLPAIAAETTVTIEPVDRWTNLFSAEPFVLRFAVRADQKFEGRVVWRLATTGRTLQRGESPMQIFAETDREDKVVSISLKAPEVKSGTTVPLQLTVGIASDQCVSANLAVDLLAFPDNPFITHQLETARQRLVLFDPLGDTNKALTQLDVPFRSLHNLEATADLSGCLLIIGEGVNWDRHRGLSQLVWKLAAEKTNVLALAPDQASLPLHGAANRQQRPESIGFRGTTVIRWLDKRLDSQSWRGDGDLIQQTFRPAFVGGQLTIQAAGGERSWPWFESDYGADAGSLIVCGFGIIENWNVTPTPRYLLLRILNYMASDHNNETKGNYER